MADCLATLADLIPEQFTKFYYDTFDTDRKSLAALYARTPSKISYTVY